MRQLTKSLTPILGILLLVGCSAEITPEIMAGVDECHQCSMVIDQVKQACGYIWEDEFVTFDSPGCLLRSYDDLRGKGGPVPSAIYFADYGDGQFHPAATTNFLLTEHLPTVMNAQVLCFGSQESAEGISAHEDEVITDWTGYRIARSQPDVTLEVAITADGMVPEAIEVAKGDIVELLVSHDQEEELTVTIEGYPEVGEVVLPAVGEQIPVRLLASRPGAGFPIVSVTDGEPLGMMKVTGAHTADEQAMQ